MSELNNKLERGTVHVVGAGMAGLAAAVSLAGKGHRVAVWEAAPGAGGRVRSFEDAATGAILDNGAHLLLAGNRAVCRYLDLVGARDRMCVFENADFPFLDMATGARWTVSFGRGRLPRWLLSAEHRPPETSALGFVADLMRLLRAKDCDAVADVLNPSSLRTRRFWEPMTRAMLNASPADGPARLLATVVRQTLLGGGAAMRPMLARKNLDDALIAPALSFLAERGCPLRTGCRLKEMHFSEGRVGALCFDGADDVRLGPADRVVLAVPPPRAADLLPSQVTPTGSRAILNAHFRVEGFDAAPAPSLTGVLGGTAEWVFRRGDVVSVTVSAADPLIDEDGSALAARLWADAARALELSGALAGAVPPHRIIKERRATFAQTTENEARRAGAVTPWRNLFLAGDWTDTGLPATIEGAVGSGFRAAELADRP